MWSECSLFLSEKTASPAVQINFEPPARMVLNSVNDVRCKMRCVMF